MTWSILVRDQESGLYGLAVASRFFAVGSLCPWSGGPHGVAMTQAQVNPTLGHRALGLLGEGYGASDVTDMLVRQDAGASWRQLHVLDAAGRSAAHTGADCTEWAGSVSGPGVSVAGNMLAGPEVVEDTLAAWLAGDGMGLPERLLAAMKAGEDAGGDFRGKQAAALRIQGSEVFPRLDIRVDDHAEPLDELARLYDVSKERFLAFSASFPRAQRPHGIIDRPVLDRLLERDEGKPFDPDPQLPED
ncbi:MAG: DUF1028 domain-containing protein [Pseudomonadota bacterium]